jgi:hypothetical protein
MAGDFLVSATPTPCSQFIKLITLGRHRAASSFAWRARGAKDKNKHVAFSAQVVARHKSFLSLLLRVSRFVSLFCFLVCATLLLTLHHAPNPLRPKQCINNFAPFNCDHHKVSRK